MEAAFPETSQSYPRLTYKSNCFRSCGKVCSMLDQIYRSRIARTVSEHDADLRSQ
jgi:hypothetical protein